MPYFAQMLPLQLTGWNSTIKGGIWQLTGWNSTFNGWNLAIDTMEFDNQGVEFGN
jgi:hypothetical protein